jgi:purine-nucleoside phosphorylase
MTAPTPFAALEEAAGSLRPLVAVVLGSGMGGVTRRLRPVVRVAFSDLPDLLPSTVPGHPGQLTLGEWAGRPVLVFEGRLHFYEGHPWERVTQPVRLAGRLGARVVLHTNAAGGIHEALGPGALMVIADHIEWTRPHWWRHPGTGGLGPARPSPYCARPPPRSVPSAPAAPTPSGCPPRARCRQAPTPASSARP